MTSSVSIVILAAGLGTRMRSSIPKVLHKVAGIPLLGHVMQAAQSIEKAQLLTILSPAQEAVASYVKKQNSHATIVWQAEQKGTGHALQQAVPCFDQDVDTVMVLCGDTPLLTADLLKAALAHHRASEAAATVVAMRLTHGGPYGRILTTTANLVDRIVEAKDASPTESAITLVNTGLLIVQRVHLEKALTQLQPQNAQGEYYLTDVVGLLTQEERPVTLYEAPHAEDFLGVNDRADLALVDNLMQQRLRHQALQQGVTLYGADSIFLSTDTKWAQDVILHPHVVIGPDVSFEAGAEVKSFSHLEGVHVGHDAVVGPHARLRPGTVLGPRTRVGNFVEIKNTHLAEGAKANHLSYLGDATIGAHSNIGAGTITCNYDGVHKWPTSIGENVFVGSNSTLVAPLTIDNDAFVAAGSTLTQDVPQDALAMSRTDQRTIASGASRLRAKIKAKSIKKEVA